MKNLFKLIAIFLMMMFFANCSEDNSENFTIGNSTTPPVDSLNKFSPPSPQEGLELYPIVIVDIDRWYICLRPYRVRNNCATYVGIMTYRSGSFVFSGNATASYDPIRDLVVIIALDSGWDRGHIVYEMKFLENSNNMEGLFFYYEYPRRVNRIIGWLEKGQIGNHIASPVKAGEAIRFDELFESKKDAKK